MRAKVVEFAVVTFVAIAFCLVISIIAADLLSIVRLQSELCEVVISCY